MGTPDSTLSTSGPPKLWTRTPVIMRVAIGMGADKPVMGDCTVTGMGMILGEEEGIEYDFKRIKSSFAFEVLNWNSLEWKFTNVNIYCTVCRAGASFIKKTIAIAPAQPAQPALLAQEVSFSIFPFLSDPLASASVI